MNESPDSSLLYTVHEDADGAMRVELTDEGMLRRLREQAQLSSPPSPLMDQQNRTFFLAERNEDGRYQVTLTEEGIRKFETALGLADDFGRHRTISTYSTIGDIMERTSTREELAHVMQRERHDLYQKMRRRILTVKYAGSDEPSTEQKAVSHTIKAGMVGLVGLWTLQQFGIAIQDVQDIPGIITQIPTDILHLDPGHAVGQVGHKIDDATAHVMSGAVGAVGTYIAAKIIRPFARIYRKDQLVPGQRLALRSLAWAVRLAEKMRHT